jgi:peptidoglycan/xylan/chitin deacetylase (PgdA/CDA1 family)
MNLLRQTAKALLTAVLPADRWLVRGPRAACRGGSVFALTFDDGPHPEWTPRVLDELRRWGQTATFFVIGREVERYPRLVQQMVDAGHCVGNHTFTHSEPKATSAEQFLEEVTHTQQLLHAWTGAAPRAMRPPKGELTWPKLRGLWRRDLTVVLWSVDPRDYRMRSAAEAERFCDRYRPRQGDIVLLHDSGPAAVSLLATWGRSGLFNRWKSVGIDHWLPRSMSAAGPRLPTAISAAAAEGGEFSEDVLLRRGSRASVVPPGGSVAVAGHRAGSPHVND